MLSLASILPTRHSDFPRDEVEGFLLDWIDMGDDAKTTPRRDSTNSTSLQTSGLPTISGRPKCQKNERQLVTLEISLDADDS